ncbi:DUF3971 domain-containing protein [Litorivita sp. NS0012-18]|uniref:YhdP family protein n=1 Tax=Litorivita sp. NS0012-18 TaxID=3127655 RepID=UPI003101BAA0
MSQDDPDTPLRKPKDAPASEGAPDAPPKAAGVGLAAAMAKLRGEEDPLGDAPDPAEAGQAQEEQPEEAMPEARDQGPTGQSAPEPEATEPSVPEAQASGEDEALQADAQQAEAKDDDARQAAPPDAPEPQNTAPDISDTADTTDTADTAEASDTAALTPVRVAPQAAPPALDAPPEAAIVVVKGKAMRRARRFGLISLVVLGFIALLAAVAIWLMLGRPIDAPQWLRERIETRLTEAAPDHQVRFGALSFLVEEDWQPRMRLRDVTVYDGAGVPLVTLDDVRAQFALRPLLDGEVRPRSVRLSGGQMELRREADGRFGLAIGNFGGDGAATLPELIKRGDAIFAQTALSALRVIEAEALTLRYVDARAGRVWSVDGGRIALARDGDAISLRADLALLGGGARAATLAVGYDSRIGSTAADFRVNIEDVEAADIASQLPALAWLGVIEAPISGALRASAQDDGALGPLNGTLQIGAGVLRPTEATRPIAFDGARSYFTYLPNEAKVQFQELSVSSKWGSAQVEGTSYLVGMQDNGWPTALLGQFRTTKLTLSPDDLYPEPITFDGASIDTRLRLDPFELDIGALTVLDRGQKFEAKGRLRALEAGWDLSLEGKLDAMTPERLMTLWPVTAVPKTRAWVSENISGGRIEQAQVALRLKPHSEAQIALGFGFEQAQVRFLKTLPPIKGAAGYAALEAGRFAVRAEAGQIAAPQGGQIDVTGTRFIVPDVRIKDGPAEVRLATQSTVTAALALLDMDPFNFLTKARQPVTIADGRAVAGGDIRFRLKKKLPVEEVEFDITAEVANARSTTLVAGHTLAAPRIDLRATPAELVISGKGSIDAIPIEGRWRAPFGAAAKAEAKAAGRQGISRAEGWIELSERFIDAFNIGLPSGSLRGAGRGDMVIDFARGTAPAFTLSSNLKGLGLRLQPLGWSLGQNAGGKLSVKGALGSPARIDALSLEAPGLSATGEVRLTAQGGLERARFSRVKAGNWLDAPVDIIGRGAGAAPAVEVRGGTVDMRQTTVGSGASNGGASSAGSGGPISLRLDRLTISDGIALSPFRGEFTTKRGMDGSFSGRVNGKAPVTGRVVPKGGRSAFEIKAKDAGAVFAASGLLDKASGGDLLLLLVPAKAVGSYDGALTAKNVRLRNAPAMAELLNAVSIVGLLEQLSGTGILFGEVDARFRLTPHEVIVTRSSATGASLGVSMDGMYNLETGAMDMQGVFSPLYLLNGIGQILSRKGEGLIGFNYRLRGTAENPRVSVNPLSILTPGMFRDIFRRPPPKLQN